jgi:protein-S-isoprenylcysteine O-methyltransferase Ste14
MFMKRDSSRDDDAENDRSPVVERRQRRAKRRQELYQFIFNVVQAISIGGSATHYARVLIVHNWTLFNYFFFFTTTVFFFFWLTARIQLGTHLTFQPKADRILITGGLYGRFRHPIYYFGTLSLVSYCFLIEKYYYLWVVLLVLVPMQCFRAVRETNLLQRKFEEDYDQYASKLWC